MNKSEGCDTCFSFHCIEASVKKSNICCLCQKEKIKDNNINYHICKRCENYNKGDV